MKFDNNCLYIKHGANREQQLSFEMSSKTLALLIFAMISIYHAQAEIYPGVYTGPTTVVSSAGVATANYCENYCPDGGCEDYYGFVTSCICECYKQGFDWYSYNQNTDDDLCTCGNGHTSNWK